MYDSQEARLSIRTEAESSGGQPSVQTQTVCVVGLGYIGLPTSALLASRGFRVWGVDIRPGVVDLINQGKPHISEPRLDEVVQQVVERGDFAAGAEPKSADVFFLCVPTPVGEQNEPDLSYVRAAAASIRSHVRPGALIILESTSPPGTTETIVAQEAVPQGLRVGEDVFVAYCPERVLPGNILRELIENDRVVGGMTAECTRRAGEFYESFVDGQVHRTSAPTAELTKLVENSYRDVNIAFANEISMLADSFSADPFRVIELANKHPRVNILTPGPGVGGHCISVDPWFLVHANPERTPLIRQAREVNLSKIDYVLQAVESLARDQLDAKIGCLGLTYKANVDDLRESPSLEITEQLQQRFGDRVVACDPLIPQDRVPALTLEPLEQVLETCEILVFLTDHAQFLELDADRLHGKCVVDTRGSYRTALGTTGMVHWPTPPPAEHLPRKRAA